MRRIFTLLALLLAIVLLCSACSLPFGPGKRAFTDLMDRFDGTLTVGDFEKVLGRHPAFDDIHVRDLSDFEGHVGYRFGERKAVYAGCTASAEELKKGLAAPFVYFDHVSGADPSSESVTSVTVGYRVSEEELQAVLDHLTGLYGSPEELTGAYRFTSADGRILVEVDAGQQPSQDGIRTIRLSWYVL